MGRGGGTLADAKLCGWVGGTCQRLGKQAGPGAGLGHGRGKE